MSTEKKKTFFSTPTAQCQSWVTPWFTGGLYFGLKKCKYENKNFIFGLLLCTRKANFREHILPILNFRLNLENINTYETFCTNWTKIICCIAAAVQQQEKTISRALMTLTLSSQIFPRWWLKSCVIHDAFEQGTWAHDEWVLNIKP